MQEKDAHALEMLETLSKQMAVAVTRCSRDFRYLWANQAYADWIQRPLNEIVGHPILDVLGKEAFEALQPYFNRVLAGETVLYEQETNFRLIGPRWTAATYTPALDVNGAANGWIAVVLDVTERKRAEEARFRHAAIVESSEDAIICKNPDALITSWNAGAERLFGYTEMEVLGRPITILIPPDLWDEENEILERLRAGGRIEHYETKRLTKAGNSVDVSLIIGPVKDSAGRIVGFSKIARDITQRKQAERALQESEQRFRLVADTAPVLIWMADTDKLCNYFNKTWSNFTGRPIHSELGNGWAEGVHSEDLQHCMNTYSQAFDRREEFRMEYRLRRHDAEYRWVLDIGVPRFNQDRSFAGYIGIAVDVTETKTSQEALHHLNRTLEGQAALLQAREELLKIFVKNVPAGVAMLDCDMRYLQVSDRFCADYSIDSDQVLGRSHYELFPDIPDRWKEIHRCALQGETLRAEEDRWDREGSVLWVRWEIRPWWKSDGSQGGVLLFAENITRIKQSEETLSKMSQKLIQAHEEERTRIARELHDDICQRIVLLALRLDEYRHGHPESLNESKRELVQASEELQDLGSDIQALSHRLHSSKLEHLGLAAAAAGFCREFSDQIGVNIDFQAGDIPRELSADISICLFRVLQEAVQNAAKHSGAKHFRVSLRNGSNQIELTVHDSGIGFDPELAIRKSGLGLTSMRERMKLVNGELSIESGMLRGTTVCARVPYESRAKSAKAG
jgi:PAS domain S-box-containing protein